MKLRIAAIILVLLLVLGWLRVRSPHQEAAKENSETTRTTLENREAVTPKAAPSAVLKVTPAKSTTAATTVLPVVENAPAVEKSETPATPEKAPPLASAVTKLPLPRFVGGHRANVPPGGALVIGGWRQPDGNRLLMFASPRSVENGQVHVASRFISLPPERLKGGDWERFLTDESISKEGGVFSAAEYAEALKRMEEFNDTDILTSPSITALFGQQATIEIGSETLEQTADGTQLKRDGISQAIIVRQIEGSGDVDLAVTAAQFSSTP